MPPANHERVKQIFLGALERTGSARTAYLRDQCGSDGRLRSDVEDLLASHSDATILPFGDNVQARQDPSSISQLSNLFAVLSFLSRTRARQLLALAIFIALTVGTGFWLRTRAHEMLRAQTGSALRSVLDSNATGLMMATNHLKAEMAAIVAMPPVTQALSRLIRTPDSRSWNDLAGTLNPLLAGRSYHSYFVLDPAGNLIATSEGLRRGLATASGMAVIGRVNAHGTTIEFPSPSPNFGQFSDTKILWPRMMVFSPIRGPDRSTVGIFCLVQAMDQTANRLRQGRPFQTGETYLFREDGLLLSPSRFAADLARWKLAEAPKASTAVQVVYARDPGRNLYDSDGVREGEEPASWPLTEAVRVATARRLTPEAEQAGVLQKPYRDYRGVQVVGAWRWLPELRIGMTAEVDESEILRTLRFIDLPIGIVTMLLVGASAWMVFSSVLLMRLRKRTLAGEALGQYVLIEKLGEGGVGEVFLAQHAFLRRPAAVKLLRRDRLSPGYLRQFEQEAQAASRLRHPNTVEIYDFGQTREGTPYYVMEYVPGLDLGRVVNQFGAMPPARAIHIAKQICSALHEAHELKVIHRDIKPSNVMLCELGGLHDFAKILDFGLAKDLANPGDDTSPLIRAGTPFYTAPERLLPSADVDRRCDIYSLGVLLYFLICGCTPYEPGLDWMESVLTREPIPPSQRLDLPASVNSVILDCMSREPDRRPASAKAVFDRLMQLEDVPVWTDEDAASAAAQSFAGSQS